MEGVRVYFCHVTLMGISGFLRLMLLLLLPPLDCNDALGNPPLPRSISAANAISPNSKVGILLFISPRIGVRSEFH